MARRGTCAHCERPAITIQARGLCGRCWARPRTPHSHLTVTKNHHDDNLANATEAELNAVIAEQLRPENLPDWWWDKDPDEN